ncbi:unnamed protein product [Linum trigynum]|uniref:Uncharacterized protein n=1 Tax=Linum trigynum TaxID=586398 RepID=A0AAV2EAX4_9ROSI
MELYNDESHGTLLEVLRCITNRNKLLGKLSHVVLYVGFALKSHISVGGKLYSTMSKRGSRNDHDFTWCGPNTSSKKFRGRMEADNLKTLTVCLKGGIYDPGSNVKFSFRRVTSYHVKLGKMTDRVDNGINGDLDYSLEAFVELDSKIGKGRAFIVVVVEDELLGSAVIPEEWIDELQEVEGGSNIDGQNRGTPCWSSPYSRTCRRSS